MTRIATLSANNQLLNILFETQQRVQRSQIQVTSGQVSEDYGGLALRSERLVNIENTAALLARFKDQNSIKDTELKINDTTLGGIRKTLTDFRDNLIIYESGALDSETRVNTIQDAAFRALKDLEIFLNTDANGEHLYSGSRVTTASANLNLSTKSAFQTKFDGEKVLFPITRDALLANFTTTNAATGNLTFAAGAPGTITAATANSFNNIPVGTTITVASSASNNRDFTVIANTGTVLTVEGTIAGITSTVTTSNVGVTAEGPVAATISATSYYQGDQVPVKHRVSKDRDFTETLNASNPAFTKAIRAMGIIAQGAFGTNGGLDQTANQGRVQDALFLINDALERTAPGVPIPFGTEPTGNLAEIITEVGFNRVLLNSANENHTSLIGFFEERISETENADQLRAVNQLLDDQRALEASFQALARIRDLSLGDFLR